MEWFIIILIISTSIFIYDKYIQRENTLLINYPVIGRLRYLFEFMREPLRQYFGENSSFAPRDKIDWVYSASRNNPTDMSFAPSTEPKNKFLFKNKQMVLNYSEISNDFSVTYGSGTRTFTAKSIINKSGMRDGSVSPEATKAFSIGAQQANCPINTGEGGLTSNFLSTMIISGDEKYLEFKEGSNLEKRIFYFLEKLINRNFAARIYRYMILGNNKENESYLLDIKTLKFFRINWNASIEYFPNQVPEGLPDIILQIGPAKYGVRTKEGTLDLDRFEKAMRFCRMSELKIAQGAKQVGGTINGQKIDATYAYYYGIEEDKNVTSPNNAFKNEQELLNTIESLQKFSNKPVGLKLVISDLMEIDSFIKNFHDSNIIPDFITVDGGNGGSSKAPLDLVNLIGFNIYTSVYFLKEILNKYNLNTKIIASGKILTGEEISTVLAIGADSVSIARGFMLSVGCIRARHCANANGKSCPMGIATLDKKKRSSFIISKQAARVKNYHNQLINSVRVIMAVIGAKNIKEITKDKLMYQEDNTVYTDIDKYFKKNFI